MQSKGAGDPEGHFRILPTTKALESVDAGQAREGGLLLDHRFRLPGIYEHLNVYGSPKCLTINKLVFGIFKEKMTYP